MNTENLKKATFTDQAAQGDLYIKRIDALPDIENLRKAEASKGEYDVARSETGHPHVITEAPNVSLYLTDDPMLSYLEVVEATDAAETLIRHLRSFDTHAPISVSPGIYEIRRQREYTPEGWRAVQD